MTLLNEADKKSQEKGINLLLDAADNNDPRAIMFLSNFIRDKDDESGPKGKEAIKNAVMQAHQKKSPDFPFWQLD